jgi:hypothetical protein
MRWPHPAEVAADLALLGMLLCACGSTLSDANKRDLQTAARLNGMAYSYQDAATPAAALERGAYCATAAVLRDQGLPAYDAGIPCAP